MGFSISARQLKDTFENIQYSLWEELKSLTWLYDWTIIIFSYLTFSLCFCIFSLFWLNLFFWTWHKDSRVSTPVSQLWRSKSFDFFSLYCMFLYRLWSGRECTLKGKPMNGPMSDMSDFFLCVRIPSDHQLWERSISHCFRRYRFVEWRFSPLPGPWLAPECSPFLFLIMTL